MHIDKNGSAREFERVAIGVDFRVLSSRLFSRSPQDARADAVKVQDDCRTVRCSDGIAQKFTRLMG